MWRKARDRKAAAFKKRLYPPMFSSAKTPPFICRSKSTAIPSCDSSLRYAGQRYRWVRSLLAVVAASSNFWVPGTEIKSYVVTSVFAKVPIHGTIRTAETVISIVVSSLPLPIKDLWNSAWDINGEYSAWLLFVYLKKLCNAIQVLPQLYRTVNIMFPSSCLISLLQLIFCGIIP